KRALMAATLRSVRTWPARSCVSSILSSNASSKSSSVSFVSPPMVGLRGGGDRDAERPLREALGALEGRSEVLHRLARVHFRDPLQRLPQPLHLFPRPRLGGQGRVSGFDQRVDLDLV